MKNYLIKGLHRIVDPNWWPGNDRSKEGDLYDCYSKMAVLSEASFLHNLQGDWTLINLILPKFNKVIPLAAAPYPTNVYP